METGMPLMILIEEHAKFQRTRCWGSLRISDKLLTWESDEPDVPGLEIDISSITSQQKAKGHLMLKISTMVHSYVFDFASETSRQNIMDTIQSLLGSVSAPKYNKKEDEYLEVKKALLEKDKDLNRLYVELVLGGVIEEDEFWRTRKNLLNSAFPDLKKQKSAINTSLLPEVSVMKEGSQRVIFNLTPEIIRQIFAERPNVHASYLHNVPRIMEERDFWLKYCKHEFAIRQKRKKISQGDYEGAQQIDDEYADLFSMPADMRVNKQLDGLRARYVDPAINLKADVNSEPCGGYVPENKEKFLNKDHSAAVLDIMEEMNSHSAVVLRGCSTEKVSDTEAAAKELAAEKLKEANKLKSNSISNNEQVLVASLHYCDERRMEDIDALSKIEGDELKLKNDINYFGAADESKYKITDIKNYKETLKVLNSISHKNLQDLIPFEISSKHIFLDFVCGNENFKGSFAQDERSSTSIILENQGPQDVLSTELLETLRSKVLAVNEILRYFWASFPITNRQKQQKVEKLKESLLLYKNNLKEICKETASKREMQYVKQLIEPVFECIRAALEKFKDQMQKIIEIF